MVQQFDSFPRRIKVPKSRVTKEKESNQMQEQQFFGFPNHEARKRGVSLKISNESNGMASKQMLEKRSE